MGLRWKLHLQQRVLYLIRFQENVIKESGGTDAVDYFARFAEEYRLTDREQEVLRELLESDESVQDIAGKLYISRTALYKHISSLNEKTDTR